MKIGWISKASPLLLLGICSSSLNAQAFTVVRSSAGIAGLGWSNSTITFDIDSSCSSYSDLVNGAIDRAATVWGKVPTSSLAVTRGTTVTLPGAITNYVGSTANSYAPTGNPIVYCDSNFESNSGASADSIPGFATGQNISSDGKIAGCLLVLNVESGGAASIVSLDSTLVDNVLTHEIGHCLGLGHSADTNALMYYSTGYGRKTVLTQDDINGVTYLYPQKEAGGVFPGCSAVAADQRTLSQRSFQDIAVSALAEIVFLISFFLIIRRAFELIP